MVLLNNGEEVSLLGAKAFVQDPYFSKYFFFARETHTLRVVGFINVDCTPGRKSIMFEATNAWAASLLSFAVRPYASVVVGA